MDLSTLRHSASHIMAQAVKELFPGTKLGIGPSIEEGFYYDFDKKEPFMPEDLEKIEKRMQEIISEGSKFTKEELKKEDAIKFFKKLGEPYKIELINELPDKTVSIYKHSNFTDLCKGPHVNSTKDIKAFKLLSIAGAYWRGSENNPMLQRIYGTAFETKEELNKYLERIEEAKKRDHRKLGKDLELFSFNDIVGAGLVLYHPNGAMIRTILEDFIRREHLKRGYQLVISPHILKSAIWVKSGHYDYYKQNMYIFKIEDEEFAVKPMNCPGHILVYKSKLRSYRDLPLRLFELGTVYRHEKSGVLHGLLRVRGFTQDDSHIFCTDTDLKNEIAGVIDFVADTLKTFGFNEFEIELSTRPTKSIGNDKDWEAATDALASTLKDKGLKYETNEGEGAFYGPKIDIKLKDAIGRTWQCATIQCDFALPERFELEYIGIDGKPHRPIMLHRVILGSLERFLGALIEHYAGEFPLWLAPLQVRLIPIAERHHKYTKDFEKTLLAEGIRAEADFKNEKMQYKIREAEVMKIPYMIIIGDKEQNGNTVSVRSKKEGDLGSMGVKEFLKRTKEEIDSKNIMTKSQ